MCEIQFWKQSNKLVQGPRLWEKLRERYGSGFTCAKLFWWYNMYSTADWTITPRPMYPADGRKIFDIYTQPMELRETIKKDLGEFPFPTFWGPMAGIRSSQWIADSARWIERKHRPDLSLIYLPYLDYDLQKFGPSSTQAAHAAEAMDDLLCDLIDFLEREGVTPVVLSEYGISDVSRSIALNRIFRERGWITVKPEMGTEMLDCGASRAFAVADHQTAHIYINDPSVKEEVKALLSATPGVEEIRETDFSGLSSAALERLPEFVNKYAFKQGIVGSVFGITAEAERQLKRLDFPLLYLNAQTPVPITNDYRTPDTLGADRLAAAVGAYMQYPGHDILIVDAGTCLTYEFIDKNGHYKGGCISPGLQMRLKSLRAFTAKLPFIDSEGPLLDIGYDTETSIRSGVIQGMKFEIEGRIKYFQEKYPSLLVFLTGGDIFNFDSKIKNLIFADKYIVPRGLNRILAFNNEQS